MAFFGFLVVATLLCQAFAQVCNGPIGNLGLLQSLQQVSSVPNFLPLSNAVSYNPIVNPSPVISTTLVDNSVANSLANTLQLLIVSELLESSLNAPSYVSPLASNIVPLYDSIGTIGTARSPLEVITRAVDIATVDVTTIVTDVVTPIVEVTQPIVTEVVTPLAAYSPSLYAPLTERVTYTNVYGSALEGQCPLVTEVTSSIPLVDFNTVSVINTPLNPYYIKSPSYVTEVTEIVQPVIEKSCLQLPSPLSFAPIDVATPVSFISDYYTGYADVVTSVPTTAPFPAEIILPQSIPAQIRCNFGYSPVNVPYLNLNVEPVGGFVF